ncbi:hypothetical protein L1987_29671 [Smallanthus sonchifolius]|uniref:Uncharacterized protein n=1 Tax=Smallanthus sonchifolius TaxID=185202 RepID=A0ACB9I020_9ASTR|nr:hypothetical protein L1987_29671 [Smallanthus sonchifolius]
MWTPNFQELTTQVHGMAAHNTKELGDLHKAIKLVEPALVSACPTVTYPGKNQEMHVFKPKSGGYAVFPSNHDPDFAAKMKFGNTQYHLPPWSISILHDCKDEVYNTAKIKAPPTQNKMTPVGTFKWQAYNEETPSSEGSDTLAMTGLSEQLIVTRNASDYLWYLAAVDISPNEHFLTNGQLPVLTVMLAGHELHVFINNQLAGTTWGSLKHPKLTISQNVKLRAGPISLKGLNEGTRDLTKQQWSYKVGLKSETLSLHKLDGSSSVEWLQGSLVAHAADCAHSRLGNESHNSIATQGSPAYVVDLQYQGNFLLFAKQDVISFGVVIVAITTTVISAMVIRLTLLARLHDQIGSSSLQGTVLLWSTSSTATHVTAALPSLGNSIGETRVLWKGETT